MINGIINIYKEAGYTSHDVVAKMRGILGQKKIGHTGTLDPQAVGVLPVCLGKATKVCELLTDKDKTYRCVMLLGTVTDTQDTCGTVLSRREVSCTEAEVQAAILGFVGDYDQIPPMYSALKVNGRKLCDLARDGKEVERQPRRVQIYDIVIERVELPRITMTVECSKGTYIRTLCHDIGQRLGCGACMEQLTRIRAAGFRLEDSVTLGRLEKAVRDGCTEELILPVDRLFAELPAFSVKAGFQKAVENGNRIPAEGVISMQEREQDGEAGHTGSGQGFGAAEAKADLRVRLYDAADRFVGIYSYQEKEHDFKPVKIFLEKD